MTAPHDPSWERFAASSHSQMVGLGREAVPSIGIGGYECTGCGDPHIIIAAIIYDVETDMFVSPAAAREIASALLMAANRVDGKGTN